MKKTVALLLVIVFGVQLRVSAVGGKDAEYIGGTVSAIPERTEGKVSVADEKLFSFDYKKGRLGIPYDRVNSLEYGQKAGRRVGVAIVVSPIALFSKKRKHYLTVNFLDDNNKQQAAVLELGKDIIRVTLSALEARTGQKIEYQDDEAKKTSRGN